MNNQIVVGIDIAMEKHQYQICDTETVYSKGAIQNNLAGGNKLLARIKEAAKDKEVIIGMEATNNYHLCLCNFLRNNGLKVVVINPLKTSAYSKIDDFGNKTDPIDAKGICNFLLDNKHKNIRQMNQKYLKLRELCRCWLKLKGDMTRISLRLRSRLIIINPEFESYFQKTLCKSGLWILEDYLIPEKIAELDVEKLQDELKKIAGVFGKKDTASRIVDLAKNTFGVKDDIEGYLRYIQYHLEEFKFLREKVFQIKKEIRRETENEYCKDDINYISSIRGIGTEVAAGILSELGDFDNFEKRSSIVRFAGLTVLRKQSGKSEGKSRMSKQGSSYLRCFLYQAAMGTKLHSATFSAVYANRKLKVKDLNPQDKKIANAKALANIARRILETIFTCEKKKRLFNDKIAFDKLKLDDFVRETIAVQFKEQLATATRQ
jgi:transposase